MNPSRFDLVQFWKAPFEFPWFNPNVKTRPYRYDIPKDRCTVDKPVPDSRYVWGLGASEGAAYYNVVHKMELDASTGRSTVPCPVCRAALTSNSNT